MNNLEILKATYSKTLQRLGKYQSVENHAHDKVIEYTKKLEQILKEIKEIEEEKYNISKLNECIDFIKNYCEGINYCSEECKFYCRIDEFNKTECLLRNNFPVDWGQIK